jgi:hypothetical protein
MADENYYLIKVTSKDPSTRSYVLVCLAVPAAKPAIDRIDVVVTHNPETVQVDTTSTYRDCKNLIQKMILNGSVSQSSSQSLLNSFQSSFSSESYLIEFQHYLEHGDTEKLCNLIAQNIQRIFGRSELENVIYVSKVSKIELDATSSIAANKEKEEKEEPAYPNPVSIPEGSKVLNYQFILSPVTGTVVSDLRLGDQVMVKIIPNSEDAIAVIAELGLKDDSGTIHPTSATIVEILKYDTKLEIVTKIGENIFGRNLEEETGVRIKMAETASSEEEDNIIREVVASNERSWFIPAIISFGILTMLWIIVTFFIL